LLLWFCPDGCNRLLALGWLIPRCGDVLAHILHLRRWVYVAQIQRSGVAVPPGSSRRWWLPTVGEVQNPRWEGRKERSGFRCCWPWRFGGRLWSWRDGRRGDALVGFTRAVGCARCSIFGGQLRSGANICSTRVHILVCLK
jgi:hypothetical protein